MHQRFDKDWRCPCDRDEKVTRGEPTWLCRLPGQLERAQPSNRSEISDNDSVAWSGQRVMVPRWASAVDPDLVRWQFFALQSARVGSTIASQAWRGKRQGWRTALTGPV